MTKFLNLHAISAFIALFFVLYSCKSDTKGGGGEDGKEQELQNRIAQLELESAMKDSIVNESLIYFNEIKANLEAISVRKDQIKALSENPELSGEDKKWILDEIRRINFMREENARKVVQLNEELSKNGVKIRQLELMIESLLNDIQWKDEQINMLQGELDQLDKEYTRLFDAYQVQSLTLDKMREEMNRVHYVYGSEKELTNNKVIEKKNGFIGIGKKTMLRDDFNEQYFTAINATKTRELKIQGTDLRFITDHPVKSYSLEQEGKFTKLKINDPAEFWKISKFLVVVVE